MRQETNHFTRSSHKSGSWRGLELELVQIHNKDVWGNKTVRYIQYHHHHHNQLTTSITIISPLGLLLPSSCPLVGHIIICVPNCKKCLRITRRHIIIVCFKMSSYFANWSHMIRSWVGISACPWGSPPSSWHKLPWKYFEKIPKQISTRIDFNNTTISQQKMHYLFEKEFLSLSCTERQK